MDCSTIKRERRVNPRFLGQGARELPVEPHFLRDQIGEVRERKRSKNYARSSYRRLPHDIVEQPVGGMEKVEKGGGQGRPEAQGWNWLAPSRCGGGKNSLSGRKKRECMGTRDSTILRNLKSEELHRLTG